MDVAVSAGRLACQVSPLLAFLGRHCRDNTRCIRDTCVTRLCGARGPAAAGRNLWLSARRYRLCPPWFLPPACCRSDICNFPDDCELSRCHGRRRPVRYAQIASLAACAVALLCLISWLFKLSLLVRLISDSILVGFKAGAGLTIIMTQLPGLFGVAGGGHNFFDRAVRLAGQLVDVNSLVLAIGLLAILLLLLGERFLPGKPVGLAVVALSILVATIFGLPSLGIPVTGQIPEGLPGLQLPAFGVLEPQELFPLAAGCLLLAYVEGISAARSFATKHGYSLDVRQEFLGLGAANLVAALGHGYPVAGGLSQSAVNDSAGARTPSRAGVLLDHAFAMPAVLHGITDKSSQGCVGCRCLYRRVQADRRPRAGAHVANQPDRFLCRIYSTCFRAATGDPARRTACGHRIHILAVGSRIAAEHRVSRTASRNWPLFG